MIAYPTFVIRLPLNDSAIADGVIFIRMKRYRSISLDQLWLTTQRVYREQHYCQDLMLEFWLVCRRFDWLLSL